MTYREFISSYYSEADRVLWKLKTLQLLNFEKAIDLLFGAWKNGQSVYVMGNGGSGSTASHLVADLAKTIVNGTNLTGLNAESPDNIPLMSAIRNDCPKEEYFIEWLKPKFSANRVGTIGVFLSVNGGEGADRGGKYSQDLLAAADFMKKNGAKTIAIAGGGPLLKMVDVPICIAVKEQSLKTPLVESFQVLIHHLLVFALKKNIKEYQEQPDYGSCCHGDNH